MSIVDSVIAGSIWTRSMLLDKKWTIMGFLHTVLFDLMWRRGGVTWRPFPCIMRIRQLVISYFTPSIVARGLLACWLKVTRALEPDARMDYGHEYNTHIANHREILVWMNRPWLPFSYNTVFTRLKYKAGPVDHFEVAFWVSVTMKKANFNWLENYVL